MTALSQLRRRDASPALVLVIVLAGVVLASLDLFIVNLAMPSMARELHERSLSTLAWVLNGYAIVYASLLVLLGRLSEARARESAFLLGALLFTLASAACGAAPSLGMLIVFRVLQAVGAALLTPASLSLVLATAAPDKRHGAVRIWSAVGGAAAALGPVVGGFLVALSWRWVFYVNVPIGLAAVTIGWMRLPHVPGHPVKRPDAFGATLVTAGIALLSLGLVEGNGWGWGSVRVIAALIASVALLAGFVTHLLRHRNPLFDPGLFRVRSFRGSALVAMVFSMAFGAMLLSIVLWMQNVWGWSALRTGLAFAPGPLMVPLVGLGHLRRRHRLVGAACGPASGLRRSGAAGHAAHRGWRGIDDADVHGDGCRRAAADGVRHRLGRDEHAAAGRARDWRVRLHRGGRHAARAGRVAAGLPARLDRDLSDRGGGRPGRPGGAATAAEPSHRGDRAVGGGGARRGGRRYWVISSIRSRACTCWLSRSSTRVTVPETGVVIVASIFIASIIATA
jgi:MFS family permease